MTVTALPSAENMQKRHEDYYERVAERIRDYLSERPAPLADIVRACEGADPAVVISSLEGLGEELVTTELPVIGLSSRGPENARGDSLLYSLEGNPVLYSWYFSTKTCARLGRLRRWSDLRIGFLGAPRLYEWFRDNELGSGRLLLDLDERALELLSRAPANDSDVVERYDVADEVPASYRGKFDCVFFDPPWKASAYLAWIRRALSLAPAGSLFFPLLPRLTRPEAGEERRRILGRLQELADTVTLLEDFLDYRIPTFKSAHLAACGVGNLEGWKGADLVIAEVDASRAAVSSDEAALPPPSWEEVDVGALRIFVDRSRRYDEGDALLFARNGRLADYEDKGANVKTSRGHRLRTSRPEELIDVLIRLRDGGLRGEPLAGALKSFDLDSLTRSLLAHTLKET